MAGYSDCAFGYFHELKQGTLLGGSTRAGDDFVPVIAVIAVMVVGCH
jgi:hypothetical protein